MNMLNIFCIDVEETIIRYSKVDSILNLSVRVGHIGKDPVCCPVFFTYLFKIKCETGGASKIYTKQKKVLTKWIFQYPILIY